MRPRNLTICLALLVAFAVIDLPAQTKLAVEPLSRSDVSAPIPEPITVEGGYKVPMPRPIRTPDPKTPTKGIKGTVLVDCVVGADGRVHDPVIRKSLSPQNDARALEAVREWRFFPTKRNGKLVAVKITVLVGF